MKSSQKPKAKRGKIKANEPYANVDEFSKSVREQSASIRPKNTSAKSRLRKSDTRSKSAKHGNEHDTKKRIKPATNYANVREEIIPIYFPL